MPTLEEAEEETEQEEEADEANLKRDEKSSPVSGPAQDAASARNEKRLATPTGGVAGVV